MRDKTRKCTGKVHFCSPEGVGGWLAAMLHLDCSWRGCKDEALACLIGGQDSSRRGVCVCVCVLSCPFVVFLFLLLYSSVSCLPLPQMRLLKRNLARKRGNCLVLTEIPLPASETHMGITRNGSHFAQTRSWRLFFAGAKPPSCKERCIVQRISTYSRTTSQTTWHMSVMHRYECVL